MKRPRLESRRKAFCTKDDLLSDDFQRIGHREIVAYRAPPGILDLSVFESRLTDCGAAAPAKIVGRFSEHRRDRSVPHRRQCTRESVASASSSARSIGTPLSLQCAGPAAEQSAFVSHFFGARTSESVNTSISMFSGRAATARVRLYTFSPQSSGGPAITICTGFALAVFTRSITFNAGSRVRRQHKVKFVVRIVEPRHRHQIFFKLAFCAFARDDQGGRRRVKSSVHDSRCRTIAEPHPSLIQGIDPRAICASTSR